MRKPSRITAAPSKSAERYQFATETDTINSVPETIAEVCAALPLNAACDQEAALALVRQLEPTEEDNLDELERRLQSTLSRLDDNADLVRKRDSGCSAAASEYHIWKKSLCEQRVSEARAQALQAERKEELEAARTICCWLVDDLVERCVSEEYEKRLAAREAARIAAIEELIRADTNARELRRREAEAASCRLRADCQAAATSSADEYLAAIRQAADERRREEQEAAERADRDEIDTLELRLKSLCARKRPLGTGR